MRNTGWGLSCDKSKKSLSSQVESPSPPQVEWTPGKTELSEEEPQLASGGGSRAGGCEAGTAVLPSGPMSPAFSAVADAEDIYST